MAAEHQTSPTEENPVPAGEQDAASGGNIPNEMSEMPVETALSPENAPDSSEKLGENPKEKPRVNPRDLLTDLRNRFEVFRAFHPLIIGIDKSVRSHYPEVDRKTLRIALSMHTHSNRYLRQLAKSKQRFDLAGEPAAELSEEHRQFAATQLQERMERQQARQTDAPASQTENAAPRVRRPQGTQRASGKPHHAKKTAVETRTDKPVERAKTETTEVSEPGAALKAKTLPDKKHNKKPRYGKNRDGKTAIANKADMANNISAAETSTPPANATLAEKLALLAEKFGRK